MHLKVFLPTRPGTLIKDITSAYKSCFNSKHSIVLGLIQCNATLILPRPPALRDFWCKALLRESVGPTVTCMTGKQQRAVNEVLSWKDGGGEFHD